MRKIDKSNIISTEYKKWIDEFDKNNLPHPKYNSTQNEYYTDVVMNLLHCQNGLCAYTEQQLCSEEAINTEKWNAGRYWDKTKMNDGELEHFDKKLKSKKTSETGIKDWQWENLFVVDEGTNTRKSTKEVDYILKPDSEDYDEFKLLDYLPETHRYTANLSLPSDIRIRINKMLEDVLGINFPNLVEKRRIKITNALSGLNSIENEFPTAMAFCKKYAEQNFNLSDIFNVK